MKEIYCFPFPHITLIQDPDSYCGGLDSLLVQLIQLVISFALRAPWYTASEESVNAGLNLNMRAGSFIFA